MRGSVLNVLERMDEEYIKMLQACDAHSTEYVDRLRDEPLVCGLIDDLLVYSESRASHEEMCRIYLKRIEHTYYKVSRMMSTVRVCMGETTCIVE